MLWRTLNSHSSEDAVHGDWIDVSYESKLLNLVKTICCQDYPPSKQFPKQPAYVLSGMGLSPVGKRFSSVAKKMKIVFYFGHP